MEIFSPPLPPGPETCNEIFPFYSPEREIEEKTGYCGGKQVFYDFGTVVSGIHPVCDKAANLSKKTVKFPYLCSSL